MNVDTLTGLLYHTYNSLFLSLPFRVIEQTGPHLPLFSQYCDKGFRAGKSPVTLVESFWEEYFEEAAPKERIDLLFHFIQYAERQVVLFDSVEDALFSQTHDLDGPGSVKHLLSHLDSEVLKKKLLEKIQVFGLRLVLTAHPTQFYPGKVLGIINDLGIEIEGHNLEHIRLLLMQLGKTAFFNRQKPTPYDEAISLGWYLENVFYHALPDILFRLLRGLHQDVTTFVNPGLLALGFWPGGDRDGNPTVTADTTILVAQRLREGALRGYYRDIRLLRRRLTFRSVEDYITTAEKKLYNTLYKPEDNDKYATCQELLDELNEARLELDKDPDNRYLTEFKDELDRFILKIRVFGFYFASLDIRQDSRKHSEVWQAILQNWNEKFPWFDVAEFQRADETTKMNRLLSTSFRLDENDFADPFVKETIRSFRAIAEIQRNNGERGCHRYIISNCQSALNVAEVLALAQLVGWEDREQISETSSTKAGVPEQSSLPLPLDIVPLFETIDDLASCGEVMHTLYTNTFYAAHLAARGNVQHIMLGFSDGTKDGGYLRANWSIYRAKEELTRVGRAHGVTVIFFDGRGGPPGRGGGNNASYYAAHGQDIENHAIHVTIQGQTVSSTYGTQASAAYNIEHLLTAGLENYLFPDHAKELKTSDRELLDELADMAYKSYLVLKNHPDFVPYLEKMTPLKWYGDTNIASRPTKRSGGEELKLEDLRAIPFVGAWAQMKQNIPGYHGVGAALQQMKKTKSKKLHELYQHSLFFRTLLENSMQALSKSNFNVTRYLEQHPRFGHFWKMLYEEYDTTGTMLLELSGQEHLLSDNPASRRSIAMREEIVLPLIAIQQFALQKLQDDNLHPDEAAIYRNLVLRAMFGIINAARNAA
ncbi:MAG TPA: phosphoenolpyruvate carboxylase [Saprospiraceae bacterium]|nr:phosphoenolpyruvate carboxylase [Saprospiraceae bacterium]